MDLLSLLKGPLRDEENPGLVRAQLGQGHVGEREILSVKLAKKKITICVFKKKNELAVTIKLMVSNRQKAGACDNWTRHLDQHL